MKELIEQRIAQLEQELAKQSEELTKAQQFMQQTIASVNAKQGAINELKELQKAMMEPVVK